MKRFTADKPEPEEIYVESVLPKPVGEMWKEYAEQFVDELPEHEQHRMKHAFYYCAYALIIDLEKVPTDDPNSDAVDADAVGEQMELWSEEVSEVLDGMDMDNYKKTSGLPDVRDVKVN